MAEQTEQKVENGSVTSTTNEPSAQAELNPVSKEFYRKQVLEKMRKDKSTSLRSLQIPIFADFEKANEQLTQTEEFKNAKNIKINFDRPQKGIFIELLKSDKTVFLSGDRKSVALLEKVDVNSLKNNENQEIDEKTISDIFRSKNHKVEVPLTDKIELDLVVIGSIAVGKDGHRIGNENGFNDLELGILTHIGAITDKTLIVTTVHDDQIVDDLKSDIFEKFDYPVDIIVTPTQILRVEKRLQRPSGIYWELLKERRVDASPTLLHLKTEEIKSGKTITFKPVTDEEDSKRKSKPKRRPGFGTRQRMRNFGRRVNKTRTSSKVNENEDIVEEKKEHPITKHSLRRDVWIHMKENKLAEKQIFKKIPIFTDHEKATELLTSSEIFKKSENIFTTYDRVFQSLKLTILKEKKTLFTPIYEGEDVLAKVKPVDEGQEVTMEYIESIQDGKKYDLINMNNAVKLDLVVLGSVLVSKEGRRIGHGKRISDLLFGYLVELGFITPETKIVTLVHTCQLQDIPENIMTEYDIPIDYIITPDEIIKVESPLTRPKGILWEYVNERQLENSAVLQALKLKKEASGETIIVKPSKSEKSRNERRRRVKLEGGNRRTKKNTETSEVSEGDHDPQSNNERRRNRRVGNTRRRLGGRKEKIIDEANELKKVLKTKSRSLDAYYVRVSNITPGIQAKEFKAEIRKLASPSFVNWNGRTRSCMLHFNKKSVDNNEDGGIENILRALENLSIDIETPEGDTKTLSKMGVKLLPERNFLESNDISRIESVDSTTV